MASQEQNARFLRGEDKPHKARPQKKSNLKRTKLKPESKAQSLDNARWAGIKEAFMFLFGPDALCGLCKNPLYQDKIDADHIIPRSKGGKSTAANCQLVHRTCHQEKHGVPWPK